MPVNEQNAKKVDKMPVKMDKMPVNWTNYQKLVKIPGNWTKCQYRKECNDWNYSLLQGGDKWSLRQIYTMLCLLHIV